MFLNSNNTLATLHLCNVLAVIMSPYCLYRECLVSDVCLGRVATRRGCGHGYRGLPDRQA